MNRTRGLRKCRRGVALLFVVIIGLLVFVAVTGLLGYLVPRQRTVTGEAISDRSLALADGFIDQLLTKINAGGELTLSAPGATEAQEDVIRTLMANLNGGDPNTDTTDVIRKKVRSYVFDSSTSTYYAFAPSPIPVFTKGVLTSGSLTSVDGTNSFGLIASIDSSFATDNRWFQIDTNCDYNYAAVKQDIWGLRVSAFNISKPELRRTVQADAGRGEVTISGALNWYTRVVGSPTEKKYCQYAGFYNNGVAYGKYEVINGPIRSNGGIDMGGWALDNVYAHGQVSNGGGTGRFGPLKSPLNDPNIGKYVFSGYPTATWDNGKTALYGTNQSRTVGDTGIQDLCSVSYYVSGDATVVFSVDSSGNGMVTINGVLLPVPSSPGLIYVGGNALVSGNVHGRLTLGCKGTINIMDNILYSIPPAVERANVDRNIVPDALGLVAGNEVFIPKSTYDKVTYVNGVAHHILEIDAAMFSVSGGLDIDSTAGTHQDSILNTPQYEAYWNGSESFNDASHAPLVEYGNGLVRGYELQHTYFDWYLTDYGAPPMFPGTGTSSVPGEVSYVLVNDNSIYAQLNGVTPKTLSTSASDYDERYPYYYDLNATRYYTMGTTVTYYGKYSPDQADLSRYRVSWKEQIATPVRQP